MSINYTACPEIMQCDQKLCGVSIYKLYSVFRKYTGCPESVYNLRAHLQGKINLFFNSTRGAQIITI